MKSVDFHKFLKTFSIISCRCFVLEEQILESCTEYIVNQLYSEDTLSCCIRWAKVVSNAGCFYGWCTDRDCIDISMFNSTECSFYHWGISTCHFNPDAFTTLLKDITSTAYTTLHSTTAKLATAKVIFISSLAIWFL